MNLRWDRKKFCGITELMCACWERNSRWRRCWPRIKSGGEFISTTPASSWYDKPRGNERLDWCAIERTGEAWPSASGRACCHHFGLSSPGHTAASREFLRFDGG